MREIPDLGCDEQVCPKCAYTRTVLIDNEGTISYDTLRQMTIHRKFTYKKLNHFPETLRQARENVNIPKDCRDRVEAEIKKSRRPTSSLEPDAMKKILRKIGYSEFYEEKVALTCYYNPEYKPIEMTVEQEELLVHMFNRIEKPFEKVKALVNPKRTNFMSYPGIARRFCELCGWSHFLRAFPLLKDEKLRVIHDEYFKNCCAMVGWGFIPTVRDVARGGLQKLIRVMDNESEPVAKKRKTSGGLDNIPKPFENDQFNTQ